MKFKVFDSEYKTEHNPRGYRGVWEAMTQSDAQADYLDDAERWGRRTGDLKIIPYGRGRAE